MSLLLQEITNKAFKLPTDERAKLACELIISLDKKDIDKEVETTWDVEIARRVVEIRSGKAKGRPAETILAEIRAKYS